MKTGKYHMMILYFNSTHSLVDCQDLRTMIQAINQWNPQYASLRPLSFFMLYLLSPYYLRSFHLDSSLFFFLPLASSFFYPDNILQMSPGEFEEKMRWIFSFFDKDGDGVVTVDELKELLNEIKDKNNLNSAGTATLSSSTYI